MTPPPPFTAAEHLGMLLAQLESARRAGDLGSPALAWSAVQQGALAWRAAKPTGHHDLTALVMQTVDTLLELSLAGDDDGLRAIADKSRRALAAQRKTRRFAPKSTDGESLVKAVRLMLKRGATDDEIAQAIAARCSTLPTFRHRFEVTVPGQRAGVSREHERAAAKAIERDRERDEDERTIVYHALRELGFSRNLARTASGGRK